MKSFIAKKSSKEGQRLILEGKGVFDLKILGFLYFFWTKKNFVLNPYPISARHCTVLFGTYLF
jgi:hypothetical protein